MLLLLLLLPLLEEAVVETEEELCDIDAIGVIVTVASTLLELALLAALFEVDGEEETERLGVTGSSASEFLLVLFLARCFAVGLLNIVFHSFENSCFSLLTEEGVWDLCSLFILWLFPENDDPTMTY